MNKTKFAALALALTALPMSIDATVLHVPGMPAEVSTYWPLVVCIASVLHKIASVFQAEK